MAPSVIPSVDEIRAKFPIFADETKPALVYLDNAATTQRPRTVIDAQSAFYESFNANIHRAPHRLAENATLAYEHVRKQAAHFLSVTDPREIVFTSGTTHSINIVALSYGFGSLKTGDEIVVTELEHHSNFVPWQMLAERTGAVLKVARVNSQSEIDLASFESCLGSKTRIVAFSEVSNALGTVNPVRKMIQLVRTLAPNAVVLVDGAQAVSHGPINVKELDCDFYALSAHKMYGPTGVGVLYGKFELLSQMAPVFGGGDMIKTVSVNGSTYAEPPARFEAGTPNIAGVIGFGAAFEFMASLDLADVDQKGDFLLKKMREGIDAIAGVRRLSLAPSSRPIVSFVVDGISPLDVAIRLNKYGVAVRTGHHCCMPLMCALGVEGTVRASCAVYNNEADLDVFLNALDTISRGTAQSDKVTQPSPSESHERPRPSGSISNAIKHYKEEFDLLDNPEDRYEMIMEIGILHPHRLDFLKTKVPRVHGCMSDVRLVLTEGDNREVIIESDSDSDFVRGLLGIVETVFSGRSKDEMRTFAPTRLPEALGLVEFVSLGRRTGLEAVLRQIEAAINLTGGSTTGH